VALLVDAVGCGKEPVSKVVNRAFNVRGCSVWTRIGKGSRDGDE